MLVMAFGIGVLSTTGCVADPPPLIGTAIAGNGSTTVSWDAPLASPSSITSYVVTPWIGSVGQLPVVVSSAARGATITSLTNGITYTFSVHAITTAGDTAESATSNSVTPGPAGAVVAVTGGGHHTCALLTEGTVECWGANGNRQLGNGSPVSGPSFAPVPVADITNAVDISAGFIHTCAALVNGTVKCWGTGDAGQLGNGSLDGSSRPVLVSGITDAVAVSAGKFHTCAVLASGSVKCWGDNHWGELGNGTTTDSSTPVSVSGLTNAIAVAGGGSHTCALIADNTGQCWGLGDFYELGNGSLTTSSTPVPVLGLTNGMGLFAGGLHACVRLADSTLDCWGYNATGQLGNGTTTTPPGLVAISGITDAVAVTAGADHSCAVLASGQVDCWGYNGTPNDDLDPNRWGQLGNGTTTDSHTPVAVSGIATASTVAAGDDHTCAVLDDGTLRCWGYGQDGQLGNGVSGNSTTPVSVIGL
jgi:alpha-tubulin suppressor-like RCC1 family protein